MSTRIKDIEGLRAIAVVSVLLYHAGLGFPGGYVGVDVFFVLSGFLITGLLIAERETRDERTLLQFWARRARRLLPAASLVITATLVSAIFLLDPLSRKRLAEDAIAASGFVANIHFGRVGADYFAANQDHSALQHWWSLAVEEQFYVVWPIAIALLWKLIPRRLGVAVLSTCVCIVSLTIGIVLTDQGSTWAYFGLHSRAWELAVGAALAAVYPLIAGVRLVRGALGWVGVGAIGLALFTFNDATAFPGTAALLPVCGTAAVLISIGSPYGPGRMLSVSVMQWFGLRSYSLYLWHWPILILIDAKWGPIEWWGRGAALLFAIVLSAATYTWVENPIRQSPRLIRSPSMSLALGGALVLASVAVAGAVGSSSSVRQTGITAETVPSIETSPTTSMPSSRAQWLAEVTKAITTTLQPAIEQSLLLTSVPDNPRPTITEAPEDKASIYTDQCLATFRMRENPPCKFGNNNSATKVVLFGDSHAAQFFTPLQKASMEEDWSLVSLTKMGCPAADIAVPHGDSPTYPECEDWRRNTIDRIVKSDADLVVIVNYSYPTRDKKRSYGPRDWAEGNRRTIAPIISSGKKVLLLSDTPTPFVDIPKCLAKNTTRISACVKARGTTVNQGRVRLEREMAESIGAMYYETSDLVCGPQKCPPVIGDMVVYMDNNHLTNTYSESLAPYLKMVVLAALSTS